MAQKLVKMKKKILIIKVVISMLLHKSLIS